MSYAVTRQVCEAEEYNEFRDRLPQRRRRQIPVLPPGHLGLIVQAVSVDDYPLRTVYGNVPVAIDPAAALDGLERELRRSMSKAGRS
jgi:hypothetical protein